MPSFNSHSRRIQRLLIGHATDLELDANGRILLSQPLREYAQLEKETVLMGQGKKMELWSKSVWEDCRDQYLSGEESDDPIPEGLLELSL